MKSQLLDQGIMPTDILKKSMFYAMWEEEFPECIIPFSFKNRMVRLPETLFLQLDNCNNSSSSTSLL
jgi:hypothetical protein